MTPVSNSGTLESLIGLHPQWINALSVTSYNDFVNQINDELDSALSDITDNPELARSDSEDRTTIDLINSLKAAFRKRSAYNISHETKIGGHADIVIVHGRYRWIAEAKIFKGTYTWLYKGLLQLLTRYSKGDENNEEGALLIYVKTPNTKRTIETWESRLVDVTNDKNKKYYFDFKPCEMMRLAFYSTIDHPRSGEKFRIRHVPVSLYFNPKDNDK